MFFNHWSQINEDTYESLSDRNIFLNQWMLLKQFRKDSSVVKWRCYNCIYFTLRIWYGGQIPISGKALVSLFTLVNDISIGLLLFALIANCYNIQIENYHALCSKSYDIWYTTVVMSLKFHIIIKTINKKITFFYKIMNLQYY